MDDQKNNIPPLSPKPEENTSLPPPPSIPAVPAEVEPSTSPLPPSQFDQPATAPSVVGSKKPRNRKKIVIITLILLLVLIGGGVAAYALWYQNPNKVVSDGIIHALQAKTTTYTGSISVGSDAAKLKVSLDGRYKFGAQDVNADVTVSMGAMDYKVKASVLIDDKSDLFIKIANLDTIIAPLRTTMFESTQGSFDDLVAKINNKWIKMSADELAAFNSQASKAQTCINKVIQQTENYASFQKEIETLYKKHTFITIGEQLGEKEGSMGYVLTIDQTKAKAFIADLKNTQLYKTLNDCDNSFMLRDDLFDTQQNQPVKTEIWISTFTHQITKIAFNTAGSQSDLTSKVELSPVFNGDVSIKTPDQATSLKQLQSDFETLQQKAIGDSI